jgi:glycosyltransferase involved in cell wall biosynthesis
VFRDFFCQGHWSSIVSPVNSPADYSVSGAFDRATEGADGTGTPLPKVTVITPAYNIEAYIGEAVESVLRQTFRDFEYLVVDDGSSDKTAEEVRVRSQGDTRLRLIMADHGGSANARNVALREAKGQLVAFLDGDDRWHPKFLERQLKLLESLSSDVAAVFARSRVISETGRLYAFRWQRSGRYDFDDMLIQACPPRCGSSLLIRKRCFDLVGDFTDQNGNEDTNMWLRIQRDTDMPYFWGSSAYLLDLRVRAGAKTRDHRKLFEENAALAREFAPALRRYPEGMAYVRLAVFAFRAGHEDFALAWARRARQAGLSRLVADSYGWRLLGWTMLPAAGRRLLRRLALVVRGLIGRIVVRAPGGLLR